MLDVRALRQDPETFRAKLKVKGFDLDISSFEQLEISRRHLQSETENLQSERNSKSRSIGKAKAAGEDIAPLVAAVGDLGDRLDEVKEQFAANQVAYQHFLREIPNVPDASVPPGTDEEDNVEIDRWGRIPEFNFEPRDHVDLGASGALDFEAAAKITGSRFVVMRGDVVRLHRALMLLMIDTHVAEHGYEELYVPYIVNEESLYGTGQLPKFAADQFKIDGDSGYYLAPTAEVPVTNLYREEIIEVDRLPIKHVTHTPCFRSEAGSYGRDTRGMIRQHQFEKVELVQLVHPESSWETLEMLTEHAGNILRKLELPFRTVVLCGGDLGFSAAKTYDLEVWLPGQNRYREISSCSNFLDFQARRMMARYRDAESGKPEFVHTLNGSGLAVGRTLVAVLENYQDGDGRIHIPDALQPYMSGQQILDLS